MKPGDNVTWICKMDNTPAFNVPVEVVKVFPKRIKIKVTGKSGDVAVKLVKPHNLKAA